MTNNVHSVLRRRQVEERTGLCRSALYQAVKSGSFPRPIRIGKRAVGWIERDVEMWIRKRIALTRKAIKEQAEPTHEMVSNAA